MRRKGIKRDFEINDEHCDSFQYASPKLVVRGKKHYGRPWKDCTLTMKG